MERFLTEWHRLTGNISELHAEPFFLPNEYLYQRMIPTTIASGVAIALLHLAISFVVPKLIKDKNFKEENMTKLCYRLTNLVFNAVVGAYGIYLEFFILPTLSVYHGESWEKLSYNHEELYIVSALQLGYQLWAIPIGLFVVGESTEMLLHHLAVGSGCVMTGFFSLGFAWYAPFFWGMVEASSVPLAVMNMFKDNPDWIKKYPGIFGLSRWLFVVSFLYLRIYHSFLRWPYLLRNNFLVFWTKEMGLLKVFYFGLWGLFMYLWYLQLFWGFLILRGVKRALFPDKKGKEKGKEKDKES